MCYVRCPNKEWPQQFLGLFHLYFIVIGRFAASMGFWVACLVRAQIPLLRVLSIRAYIGTYLEPPGEEYQCLYKILLGL